MRHLVTGMLGLGVLLTLGLSQQAAAQSCRFIDITDNGSTSCADSFSSNPGILGIGTDQPSAGDSVLSDGNITINLSVSSDESEVSYSASAPGITAVILESGGKKNTQILTRIYQDGCTEDQNLSTPAMNSLQSVEFCYGTELQTVGFADCPLVPSSQDESDFWALLPGWINIAQLETDDTVTGGETDNSLPALCCRPGTNCTTCDPTLTEDDPNAPFPPCYVIDEEPAQARGGNTTNYTPLTSSSVRCPGGQLIKIGGTKVCVLTD